MDINYYARLYRVRPLEVKVCQTFYPCIDDTTYTFRFLDIVIISCAFVSFLLPASDTKQ